jgi:hypothetical protein
VPDVRAAIDGYRARQPTPTTPIPAH